MTIEQIAADIAQKRGKTRPVLIGIEGLPNISRYHYKNM